MGHVTLDIASGLWREEKENRQVCTLFSFGWGVANRLRGGIRTHGGARIRANGARRRQRYEPRAHHTDEVGNYELPTAIEHRKYARSGDTSVAYVRTTVPI